MKSIELKKRNLLAFKDLLKGIQRLDISALEAFAIELNRLIANRKKQPEIDREKELVKLIKTHIPSSVRRHQQQLYLKLQDGIISETEKKELELLNSMMEKKSAERIHLMGNWLRCVKLPCPN